MSPSAPGRGRARLALWLAIAVAVGFFVARRFEHGTPPPLPPAAAAPAPPAAGAERRNDGTGATAGARDLAADEARGGHTLHRHVGRSDAELAERLRRERGIAAASTFFDRPTAERTVGEVLADHAAEVARWSSRGAPRPNLALFGCPADGRPVGRSLARGDRAPREVACARVVLRAAGGETYVLTAYPAARGGEER